MTFTLNDIKDYLNIDQVQLMRIVKAAHVRLKRAANGRNWEPLNPSQAARILEVHLRRRRK